MARDASFLAFVDKVLDAAFTGRQTDVAALMAGDLEATPRSPGAENRRKYWRAPYCARWSADAGVVGAYVHGNNRIAVLVALTGGDNDLARTWPCTWPDQPQVVSPADMPARNDRQRV